MGPSERKNGWQVSLAMGETSPYATQHLLHRARWDCDGVRDELRAYVSEVLATPEALVVIDETGFLTARTATSGSVFVALQYSVHQICVRAEG